MVRLFKHYIPRSLVVLSIVEMLVCLLSVQLALIIWRSSTDSEIFIESVAATSVLFGLAILLCMIVMGLYQRHLRDGRRGMFFRINIAFIIAFVVLSFLFYLIPSLSLGRGVFGTAFFIAFFVVTMSRLVYVSMVNRELLKRRLLVVGVGKNARMINDLLRRRSDRRGFSIVGYLSYNDEKSLIGDEELEVNGESLLQIAERLDIDEIVMAVTDRRKGFPLDDLLDCKMRGIDVIDLQTFFEMQAGRVLLKLLHPSWFILSDGFSKSLSKDIIKRAFDVLASSLLLIVTIPIMIITMIAIYLEDKGNVFYSQVRVGKDDEPISVIKFRSMRVDAERCGSPQFAKTDDDRVTRVGKIIRKTRIDELPQLFNVLLGQMSFVGPRPERPEFVAQFSKSIPYYNERHRIKPGITGWAQICYPYGASEHDTTEKLQYDLYYAKNYSIFLDLTVLVQTAEVILWGKGAR